MKKTIFTLTTALLALSSCSAGETDINALYGKYRSGITQIEITKDSIFIDEIGNEGFGYTYTYDAQKHTFTLTDALGYSDTYLRVEKSAEGKNKTLVTLFGDNSDNPETIEYIKEN